MNERFKRLFDHVAYEVAASGGDGCGIIVFKQTSVQEAAKAFEEWKAAQPWPDWLPHRLNYSPNRILFTDMSNENITLVSKSEVCSWDPVARGIGQNEVWLEVW